MTTQNHDRWIERLSDHVDGGLSSEESRALEAHLAGCAECRQTLADLRDIVARARELGPVEPERDLWPGIEEAMGRPRVLAFPTTRRRPGPRGLFLTMPQMAAAAAVLVLVSGVATWWAGPGIGATGARAGAPDTATPPAGGAAVLAAEVAAPAPELAQELASLEAVLTQARSSLDPKTVRILEKNLGVIERAISESRHALEVDPGNEYLRQHLDRAYRDKADFLREVAIISEWEG
jgi:anti-sigma factor RsiW